MRCQAHVESCVSREIIDQLTIRKVVRKISASRLVEVELDMDLSRFDAAPLIAFTVTKETDYWAEMDGGIPPRCSADYTDQRADAETGD
jgi:hypothetical protein